MARQSNGWAARLEYGLFQMARGALGALAYERAVRFGARLGGVAAVLDRVNRPVALRNLEIAFPSLTSAERTAILRATWRNLGRFAAEWSHQGELTPATIGGYVVYQGLDENLGRARELSRSGGVLVLTAHFGNIELMAHAHALYGHRIATVRRPLRNFFVAQAIEAARTSAGNRVISRRGGVRDILRTLAEGWLVAIALDLDVRRGVFVDFFSLPASTSDGVARLAMKTGTPVLPVFIERDGVGIRHTIRVLPPVELADGAGPAAARENTQRFTRVIETMVRARPDHWNWIHRRWKTRPAGEPRFY